MQGSAFIYSEERLTTVQCAKVISHVLLPVLEQCAAVNLCSFSRYPPVLVILLRPRS